MRSLFSWDTMDSDKSPEKHSAPPTIRKIVKAKRRFDPVHHEPVNLLKDKLKTDISGKLSEKKKAMDALDNAFSNFGLTEPSKKMRYEGGWYTVHTGERGGKYIMVEGKKKYVRPRK